MSASFVVIQDDSSSASTDSSHTLQPSPPITFTDAPAEISPEPLHLADDGDETSRDSENFDDAVCEQLIEENGRHIDYDSGDSEDSPDFEEQVEIATPSLEGMAEDSERNVIPLHSHGRDAMVDLTAEIEDATEAWEEEEEDSEEESDSDDGSSEDGEDEDTSEDDDISTGSEIDAYDDDDMEEPADIFAFSSSFAEHAARMSKESRDAWKRFYPDDSSDDSADDEMNLERIEDILFLAECRLRDQEKALHFIKTPLPTASESSTVDELRLPKPYIRSSNKIVRPDAKELVNPKMRALANKPRVITETVPVNKAGKKKVPASGLITQFGLPRTKITPELKRDLQLLSMRAVLDPKRMYKRQGKFKIPEYSQVGTIIEGPTDFFGGRLNKKERRENFVGEVMKTESQTGRFKRKYDELQSKKRSGKKASYKAKVEKRRKF